MRRVLNKHGEIKSAFDSYMGTLKQTEARRDLWKSETKDKLLDTLSLIEKDFEFDWHVQKIDLMDNYQTVNISCNNKNSGIVEREIDLDTGKIKRSKAHVKRGGYLAYCQSYNGKINVIVGFPSIDELVDEKEVKVIANIEPKQLTEELISEQVIEFLKLLSDWEGMDRAPIGFK